MFKLLAYFESIAASQTDSDQNAIQGQGDFVVNGHHVLDRDSWVVGAYSSGLGNTQARLDVPDLRSVAPVQIRPLNRILLPPTDYNFFDVRRRPIRIRRDQEMRVLVTTDATAGPNNTYTGLLVHDGNYAVTPGDPYVIRATGTTTLVAGAWTLVTLTYQDQLPPGTYEITGVECISATGIFFRLVFVGDTYYRPGGVCLQNEGQRPFFPFLGVDQGLDLTGFGSWGQFRNIYNPSIEIMANAADTAQTVYFHVRKVA